MSLREIARAKSEIYEENERECFGNKYGFIEVKNPYYMQDYSSDSEEHDCSREYLLRKPTPSERREIVINTIIQSKGRAFSIVKLASLLAVSDRTIQTLLRNLQKEGLINITPHYGKNGARKCNSYRYIGEPCKRYGTGLTLKMLYDTEEGCGFRNWAWSNKMFPHDGKFYDMYNQCKAKFAVRVERREYLERHGLPLIVPEPIKYLVLRYTYWTGNERVDEWDRKTVNRTVKVPLFTGEKYKTMTICGHSLTLYFTGEENNPIVNIFMDGQKISAFSWFTENIYEVEARLSDNKIEQFLLLGDFTTK